jgi:hypothetical protein
MTQTTHLAEPKSAPAARPDIAFPDILLNLIVAFLAPMFLSASDGDIAYARMAALRAINDYRAESHADLLAVAQIIGFGLAALGSIGLSMNDNISLSMMLRLRGNATALHRAGEQNRRALEKSQGSIAAPLPAATPTEADYLHQAEVAAGAAESRKLIAAARARMREEERSLDHAAIPVPAPLAAPHHR